MNKTSTKIKRILLNFIKCGKAQNLEILTSKTKGLPTKPKS